MDYRLNIADLNNPADLLKLKNAISELAADLDVIYTTSAPNGNISARIGRLAIYKNGAAYETWQNIDGATAWQQVGAEAFATGDWILSSVTTARDGWTNVSATHANKFMRINATPLSTGGADTHTHGAGTFAGASHTHAAGTFAGPSHTHPQNSGGVWADADNSGTGVVATSTSNAAMFISPGGGGASRTRMNSGVSAGGNGAITGASAADGTGTITGTSAAGNNVPAYVQVVIFQKD